MKKSIFLTVFVLLVIVHLALPQTRTGVLTGRITDEQGEALPGVSVTVTEIKMWAKGYDDTAVTVLEFDADGASNQATVDAINCTTGSDPYTDTETTITGATIEADHIVCLDLDATDDPEQLWGYIKYEW